ncbi:MAG: DEAD/DEAH box helicase [Bryobacter sp.]|nr:DEAD/DEAH box helicase [Bryobacter sp.]
MKLHCSAWDGQLYFWVQGAGPGVARALSSLGLGRRIPARELQRVYLCLPDEDGTFRDWERKAIPCPAAYWWYVYENARFQRQGEQAQSTGADFRYWLVVTQWVDQILRSGNFLPGVQQHKGVWHATWEPVLLGKDRERFQQLAEAMPDSARALRPDPQQNAAYPRHTCLWAVLVALVDAGVREAAQGTGKLHAPGSYGRWLAALTGTFNTIVGENSVLQRLERDLAFWKASLLAEQEQGGCLELLLWEPQEDSEDWAVELFWQPAKGNRLPFEELEGQTMGHAWRAAEEAARIYPSLLRLGQTQWRGRLRLTAEEVPEFREHWAENLEAAGFQVTIPESLDQAQMKSVRLSARMEGGVFSREALVKLDWRVSVDDQLLGAEEIETMAARKSPLQKVGGRWMMVDSEGLREAARFLRTQKDKQLRLREALRIALGLLPLEATVEFGGVEAEGWLGNLLGELQQGDQVRELAPPDNLRGELRPYQVRGYSWLSFLTKFGLGACLADDMGLGKSIQTLAFLLARKPQQEAPVLLVCPTSVIGNWQRECQRFAPSLRVWVHHGADRRKHEDFQRVVAKHDLVVASYPLIHRDLKSLSQIEWEGIVLDEAQNIKNATAKQSQAVRSLKGGFKIALTGTPIENSVGDLYSLMQFLNPGHLGNAAEFQRRFLAPIEKRNDARAARLLKRMSAPFLLRRLKTDRSILSELPEKLEMKVFCKLTREQGRLYDDVIRQQFEELEKQTGMARRGAILATLMKLKQICNHPKQYLRDDGATAQRSGKLLRLEEMIEEILANGEKALVFTQFSEMGMLLAKHLRDRLGSEVPFLYGATPRAERDRMVDAFQSKGGPSLFLLSLKAGGTGLNLTAATHVFHYDRWWNPAVENQATDRAYRIGQTSKVEVHKFLTMGTVEERIDQMLEQKQQLAEQIVDGAETWLTEMSNDELRTLFARGEEALAE